MVYTEDLKSSESNLMWVRLPPWALLISKTMEETLEIKEDNEAEKKLLFDKIYQEALAKEGNIIEFEGPYSKKEFLDYVVKNYDVVLHGSNNKDIGEFEPRQANCASKNSLILTILKRLRSK